MSTEFSTPQKDLWTLPNGLRIIGERLPYLRSVSIGVWVHSGSMMEKPEENGLSHFLEHMVFKGTEKRNARQIAEDMDAVGGQVNAFTGKDCTCFYAKVIDEELENAVELLSDLTIHATLDPDELEKERGVILEEINIDEDSPEDLAQDLLCAAQYGKQSLGMPILGPASQVSAYTRDDLFRYRAAHYHPADTVIALCGNYEPEQVRDLMEKYFGEWKTEGTRTILLPQAVLDRQCLVKEKDTEQLNICLGFPGSPYGSDQSFPMSVLLNILGGAMSSRLFQRIREDLGMAYTVYAYPNSYVGSGTFAVYAGVSPKNGRQTIIEIRKELDKLLREGITEKEYLSAVKQIRTAFLMGLESPGSRMQAMGRRMLHLGDTVPPEVTIRKIESVTMDDVMDFARSILVHEPSLSAAGKTAGKYSLEDLA